MQLSRVGHGSWVFGGGDYWGQINQKEADAVVRRALDQGVNYFDTAEAYNDGRSEESLGRAIRGIQRDQVVIGSKVGPHNAYHDVLIAHCEASLRRLGTDYIDLYMVHWPIHARALRNFTKDEALINNPPSVEEAVRALTILRDQGKILEIGVSNFGVRWTELFRQAGITPAYNQLPYSLLSRAIEYEVLPYCRTNGIGVVGYMPLMEGLLTDRYETLDDVPHLYARTRHFSNERSPLSRHGEAGLETETMAAIQAVRKIAREAGVSTAALAMRWAVEFVDCAIVGTRNPDRLEENVRAAGMHVLPSVFDALDQATAELKRLLGNHVDLWESAENDRTV